MDMIYLDHAAATPVHPKALAAMLPYFTEDFFNPSAPYLPAKHVREAYNAAKDALAHTIGAKGVDLVMTAGATESINLAFTVCRAFDSSAKTQTNSSSAAVRSKILVLATEHAAVLEAARNYCHELIKVDRSGLVQLDDLRVKLTDEVVLISVSLANNELGTIQPLAEIAELVRAVRQERLERGITTPLYLHSDASQALSLIDLNVARLGVDLLTLNAAKCGGPKGVGALYVGHGVPLTPLSFGGGQERGLRSGTENVPGVIGFAAAAVEAQKHLASSRKQYQKMAQTLRQAFKTLPEPLFLGNPKRQLANFVPVSFPGLDAERLIYKLEAQGIYLSTGAACAANKGTKSHVLAAIGLSDAEIAGSLRISLGPTNTPEQITEAAQKIIETVRREYARALPRDYDAFRESPEVTTEDEDARPPQRRADATSCPEKDYKHAAEEEHTRV